jgi:hypothetical protein
MHLIEKPPMGQFLVTLLLVIAVSLLMIVFPLAVLPR